MEKVVSKYKVWKFELDAVLLPYYGDEIAKKLGIDPSYYRRCIKGDETITVSFLRKFYSVFGEEIEEIHRLEAIKKENELSNKIICLTERVERLCTKCVQLIKLNNSLVRKLHQKK